MYKLREKKRISIQIDIERDFSDEVLKLIIIKRPWFLNTTFIGVFLIH